MQVPSLVEELKSHVLCVCVCVCACMLTRFSRVLLFVTPWTVPLGSSAQGIVPARTLEWVAIPFSRGSSQPRDQTCVSGGSCIADRFFTLSHQGRRRCAGQPEENEGRQEARSHLKLREGPVPGSPWRAGGRLLSVSSSFPSVRVCDPNVPSSRGR